jgi:hypothetical protein
LKKQQCVALSSTKAEYVALTTCIQSGIAICSLATQLKLEVPSPTIVMCDNEGAISLSSETSHQSRAKHIDIKYHFIRMHIQNGTFKVGYVKSQVGKGRGLAGV